MFFWVLIEYLFFLNMCPSLITAAVSLAVSLTLLFQQQQVDTQVHSLPVAIKWKSIKLFCLSLHAAHIDRCMKTHHYQ